MSEIDVWSQEASDLLEQHRLQSLEVNRIKRERELQQARLRSANRMRLAMYDLANGYYDHGRGDVDEQLERLGEVMDEHSLTAEQRRDIWAWAARADDECGW